MSWQRWWRMLAGLVVIALGVVFLLDSLGVARAGRILSAFWPVLLILLGLLILWSRWRRWGYCCAGAAGQGAIAGEVKVGEGAAQWDLHDMDTRMGAGQLRLDLTRARVPLGETKLRLSGGVGEIRVAVPPGLAVSVRAEVAMGSIDILGQKADGLGRQLSYSTPGYKSADRKVRMDISLAMGQASVAAG